MRLYLVQHGEAFSEEQNPERPLTEKGRNDSTRTAEFLKKAEVNIDVIRHSNKLRAIETAQIFAEKLSPKEGTEQKEGLSPNDPPEEVLDEITSMNKNIMVVGHLPFLQKLTSLLLINSESPPIVKFNMAGCVGLEKEASGWQLIFEIIPGLLK